MHRLSRNEWIAVAVAVIVVAYFLLGSLVGNWFGKPSVNTNQNMTADGQNLNPDAASTTNATSTEEATSTTEVARQGSIITVSYVGKLQNGQVFDRSADHGGSFTFVLGEGQVIQGWDQGLMGTKAGDHKTLTIPPEQAYGAVEGHPLQHETLIFDVDVLNVKNK